MNQDFHIPNAQADGVECGGKLNDGAVGRGIDPAILRLDAAADTHDALGEHGIGNLIHGHHRAADAGRQHGIPVLFLKKIKYHVLVL